MGVGRRGGGGVVLFVKCMELHVKLRMLRLNQVLVCHMIGKTDKAGSPKKIKELPPVMKV